MSQQPDEKKPRKKEPPPPETGGGGGGPERPREGGTRFVISHLRHLHRDPEKKMMSRAAFDARIHRVLGNVDVIADNAPAEQERRVLVVRGNPQDLLAQADALSPDTIIERELPREPALAEPPVLRLWKALQGPRAEPPQQGAALELTLTSEGRPVRGSGVILLLARTAPPPQGQPSATSVGSRSDADGKAVFEYDPAQWAPSMVVVMPAGGAWSVVIQKPQAKQTIDLPPLPRQGPLGWWHLVMGATSYADDIGAGLRIGVIDTGVGPHPYLAHVKSIGAFLEGDWLQAPDAGLDARDHGTHVCGLIGARPAGGSGDYGGLAPGAELLMARVFTATGGGNQGDISRAIDALALQEVDLINMSLVGEASLLERDAILSALQWGTLCICSAGNQSGAPVGFPAGYPESVAVSGLGLLGTSPEHSIASMNVPSTPDKFSATGLFLASFSNIGPQLACTAPGNGIISTIPVTPQGLPAPYADMSGTSMSAPLTVGALAALLSRDPVYASLPRDGSRAAYARAALIRSSLQIGLDPIYQGYGLARELLP